MKLGIDVHGIISRDPLFFSELSKIFIREGHQIHIITGRRVTPLLKAYLDSYKIYYTRIFSIIDYHLSIGTKVTYKDPDNPWIDQDLWNKAKAEYCEQEKIDFHIDDSEVYGNYFKTPYCRIRYDLRCFEWVFNGQSGAFVFNVPESIYKYILEIVENIQKHNKNNNI